MADQAGHPARHADQYRRARARGAAMHAARFLCVDRAHAPDGNEIVARTIFDFVMPGLDPGIQADGTLANNLPRLSHAALQHGPPGQARW